MNDELLKNVIIFDGKNEYTEVEILNDKMLYEFFKRYYVWAFPKAIVNDVLKENGIFYLSTDKDFLKTTITLRNVSQELKDQFYNLYIR